MFTPEERERWRQNRKLETSAVIARLPSEARRNAEIVGRWVWLNFTTKPASEILNAIKALGFSWNGRRRVWQHPCGKFCPKSGGDPRLKYGVIRLEDYDETPE